jgi:hypothetical protein
VGDPAAVTREVVNARWTKNFYANGDITMSDRDTGLMWLYNANPCGATNWGAAVTFCNNLVYAGYSDWRLPSKTELASQFHAAEYFINFKNLSLSDFYWSSTPNTIFGASDYVWSIRMADGSLTDGGLKTKNDYVWPVRSGQ